MKRVISLMLLCGMTFMLMACVPQRTTQKNESDGLDFLQQEFIIRDGDSGNDFLPTPGDNEHTDMLLDRYEQMEEDYNMVLTTEIGTIEDLTMAFVIWDHYADIMSMRLKNTYKAFAADFILPMEDIGTIDMYSGKYGSESLLNELNWKGETVAFWPAYWGIPMPAFQDAMMYNPRLLSEFGLQNPQEMYEKNTWTWEAYKSMAKAVESAVNYSSTEEYPVYFSCLDLYTLRLALYSNGSSMITMDSNGRYRLNLNSSKSRQAVDWLKELAEIDSFMDFASTGHTNMTFYDGRMIFFPEYSVTGLMHSSGAIGLNMDEEWRYCYYPLGPQGTKEDVERSYFSYQTRFVSPIRLTDDEDQLGVVMELLFEPLYETEDGWQEIFYDINFFDDYSVEYYKTKWSNIKSDCSFFLNDPEKELKEITAIQAGLSSASGTYQSYLEGNLERLQKELDDNISNLN